MRNLLRQIKFGLQAFLRNGWLTIAQIFILSITVTIWILSIFSFAIGNIVLDEVGKKFDIELTLRKGLGEEEILKVENFLISLNEVREYRKIFNEERISSVERILLEDKDKNEIEESQWREALRGLDLGTSFRIKLESPEKYNAFFKKLSLSTLEPLFYNLESDKIAIEKSLGEFEKWTNFAKISTIVFGIFFVLLSFMITFESIKTSIETRKDEFEIMKLVGAEKSFIKNPLLIESFLASLFSEILILSLTFGGLSTFQSKLDSFFIKVIKFDAYSFFLSNFLQISLGTFFGLSVISYISSSISIKKHLKM